MKIKDFPTLWGVLLTLAISHTMGSIVMTVTPYPARIYAMAPPGTPVLYVHGYDDPTGAKLDNMYLSPGVNSSYFSINTETGLLSVKKQINWALGTTLSFFVYGGVGSQLEYKHVMIIVSQKNLYPPTFLSSTKNNFKIYRYAVGERIGSVSAIDRDTESYNNIFTYRIADEGADTYLKLSSTGEITLKRSPPESIPLLSFPITATDEGSPRLTGSTMIQVELVDIRQPSIFCFATDLTSTTLCWKNAMIGRPEVTGFEVEVTGAMDKTLTVAAKGEEEEVCEEVDGTEINKQYFFRVSVKTATTTNINRMKIMINTTGIGFTPQCLHNDFDSCKYLKPCQNGAQCRREEDGALNYHCDCTEGWQGKNCTLKDLCSTNPCQNGGQCRFEGHLQYTCSCVDDFFGRNCQNFNSCSITPCQNNGTCSIDATGIYTCACQDHFTGKNCEQRDPCQPSPCQRGTCTRITDTKFACQCVKGYYGDTCSEINMCELEEPCLSGGTCQHIDNGTFICNCPFGSTGPRCNLFDPCSRSPCRNEATCELKDGGEYHCLCQPGFYGGECQHYNTCYGIQCGSGSCKQVLGAPICTCERGYYGDKCQFYNPCVGENPCELRGQCRNISDNQYECDCVAERYGLQCQYLNSCRLPDICQNGGICENIPSSEEVKFRCKCPEGYYGHTCAFYNPCITRPCSHGNCRNISSNNYVCDCQDGFYGKNCNIGDPCLTHPCANSGTCSVDPSTVQKSCQCTELYTGQNCETRVQLCNRTSCQNGGTCQADVGMCLCTDQFTGVHCESPITPCTSNPCIGGKICRVEGIGYECVCPNNANNDACIEDCPEEETVDKTGRYKWPRTARGKRVTLDCGLSAKHHQPQVARRCQNLPGNRAAWSPVDSSKCPELGLAGAEKALTELMSLTSDPNAINADQLANFTNVLEEVFFYSLDNTQIADSMTSVVSNLADVNESVTAECDSTNKTSERLVNLLQNYTANTSNTDNIVSSNINVRAVDVSDTSAPVNFEPSLMDGNDTVKSGISITLPPEVFAAASSTSSLPLRVQFTGFKKSVFFMAADRVDIDYNKQKVVTATVKGTDIKNLQSPVVYTLQNFENGVNHSCYYWDTETKTWKNDGVKTIHTSGNTTECHSTHLTSFAILMDPNSHLPALPVIHEQILTYISYVGCAISLVGLVLTIITYGLFRCLNKDKSGKILLNLCVSMMLMNIVFLMGSQSASTYGEQLCTAVAVMLHYFLLATLMWMLVEALEMYQALITVFAKYARFYMVKRCVVAWGVPLVIVIITLAVDVQHYNPPQDFCFISQASKIAYYVALVAPGCLIVVINTIVFIMVARVILKPRFNQQQREDKERVTPAQVRGAFTVMILLGVTWVFGPIAINEARLVFNYMFCILNSLQGFFIFVFRCVFNPEARLAWYQLIKMGTLKTKRGPIKSVYSETSSKAEQSKSKTNGHFGGTLKSNIMQTNGWHHPKLNGIPPEQDGARRDTQCFTMSQNSEENVFHTKDDLYLDSHTPPTRVEVMEDGFTHL